MQYQITTNYSEMMQYPITTQYSEMKEYPITTQYSEIMQYPIATQYPEMMQYPITTPHSTVVKELRSKMFRQHPGYYKAIFLKKTQVIIVSFYDYAVYIMFYDCYYYYCHFCPNIIAFCSIKLDFV